MRFDILNTITLSDIFLTVHPLPYSINLKEMWNNRPSVRREARTENIPPKWRQASKCEGNRIEETSCDRSRINGGNAGGKGRQKGVIDYRLNVNDDGRDDEMGMYLHVPDAISR